MVALVLETASETSTFQVRQLELGAEIGEVKKLKCLAIPETHYVGRILLGGENLLAVPEIKESGHIPPEFYENFVKGVDAKTDTVLASFNQVVMDTVSWSDDWLFLKEMTYVEKHSLFYSHFSINLTITLTRQNSSTTTGSAVRD